MPRTRVYTTREELVTSMGRIVAREVKHYQSDFTEYDRRWILDPQYVTEGSAWFWMTRESGTHMIRYNHEDVSDRIKAWDYVRAILECYGPDNVKVREIIKGHGCISIDSPRNSNEVLACAIDVRRREEI